MPQDASASIQSIETFLRCVGIMPSASFPSAMAGVAMEVTAFDPGGEKQNSCLWLKIILHVQKIRIPK